MNIKLFNLKRIRRADRTRNSIGKGSAEKPRLSVFRSNANIYAQLIDDVSGKTLVSASSMEIKEKMKKADVAKAVGVLVANKAIKAGITKAVFDRGKYKYHGRVKALADGAREGKLEF